MSHIASVAVIGAGIAGLACARALQTSGLAVTLFDKGRRPGGRIATRRADGLSFDHGAQYATARDPAFRAVIAGLAEAGAVAPWPAAARDRDIAWVGTPGMSALARHLADTLARDGAALHMDRHVGYLHKATDQTWAIRHLPAASVRPGTVTDAGGDLAEGFDAILLALPAPQAIPLLAAIGHDHADALSGVTFAPCWAVMAAFTDRIDSPDTARPDTGPLGWVAREGSRPGHATSPDAWVLHASPAWSRANLERAAEDVAMELAETFAPGRPPLHLHAHRWRYALVETPLGIPCLWNARTRVGVCGDFCLGARVEAAWLSGTALAAAVLA